MIIKMTVGFVMLFSLPAVAIQNVPQLKSLQNQPQYVNTQYSSIPSLITDANAGALNAGTLYVVGNRQIFYNGSTLLAEDNAPLVRLVASRAGQNNNLNQGAISYYLGYTTHIAHRTINTIGVAYQNWKVSAFHPPYGEVAFGPNNATVQVAIEYPIGTPVRTGFTCNGASTCIGAPGATITTDLMHLASKIQDGDAFRLWTYWYNPDGIPYTDKGYSPVSLSPATDSAILPDSASYNSTGNFGGTTVVSGNMPQQATNNIIMLPVAIIGVTDTPGSAIFEYGGSRIRGLAHSPDAALFVGETDSIFGPSFATANFGVDGDTLWNNTNLLGGNTNRAALIKSYGTDLIAELGSNDIMSGHPLSQVISATQAFAQAFAPIPVHWTTVMPYTNSAAPGGWLTVAGQTTLPAVEATRIAYNTSLRGGIPGLSSIIDFALDTEVSCATGVVALNGGCWPAGLGATVTGSIYNGSNLLTVTSMSSGQIHIGDVIYGTGLPPAQTMAGGAPGGAYVVIQTVNNNANGLPGHEGVYQLSNYATAYGSGVYQAATSTPDGVHEINYLNKLRLLNQLGQREYFTLH